MKLDRRVLGYFSMVFVTALCYALIQVDKAVLAGVIGACYLAFALGVDKLKIDLKNKKIELQDDNKSD